MTKLATSENRERKTTSGVSLGETKDKQEQAVCGVTKARPFKVALPFLEKTARQRENRQLASDAKRRQDKSRVLEILQSRIHQAKIAERGGRSDSDTEIF